MVMDGDGWRWMFFWLPFLNLESESPYAGCVLFFLWPFLEFFRGDCKGDVQGDTRGEGSSGSIHSLSNAGFTFLSPVQGRTTLPPGLLGITS